jgi:hypothetical protein
MGIGAPLGQMQGCASIPIDADRQDPRAESVQSTQRRCLAERIVQTMRL